MRYRLLTINNPKTLKGKDVNDKYITAIMHMSPINTRICPYQDIAGCKVACLNTAGRGGIYKKGETTNVIQEARKRKTSMYLEARNFFMKDLIIDIGKFEDTVKIRQSYLLLDLMVLVIYNGKQLTLIIKIYLNTFLVFNFMITLKYLLEKLQVLITTI